MSAARLQIPLTDEQVAQWKTRIDAGARVVKSKTEDWRKQQAAYIGKPLTSIPEDDFVAVNKDMPRVKQKVSQLFYQVPEVHLKPKSPQYAPAVSTFQAVINHKLTAEMHVEKMVDEVLTDVVAVSGLGVSKIGYEVVTQDVDEPLVDPESPEGQLIVAQGGQIPTEKIPVPIYEGYFWRRLTPAKGLLPVEFVGTNFDDSPWVGFRYRKPWSRAKRDYKIDETEATTRDELTVSDDTATETERTEKEVECTEIWYKASLYDLNVKNPLKQRRLVFVEGREQPVVHEDSPYQRFDEKTGKFLVGMKKYPVRFLTLTTVPDEAIPPSDTQITRPLVTELQISRSQMIKQRKRALPMRWFNTSILDPEVAEKIKNGDIQDMIPTPAPGDQAIGEVARANYPRETFEFQRVIEGDMMEAWALGSNQLGSDSPGEVTATEAQNIQSNTNVRLDYERNKVLRWFLEGAELVGDLIQLFADDEDFIEVVGPERTKMMVAWDKTTISGEYVYTARTNSQLRLDIAQERMDARNAYQLLANEPFANRQKLVERLAETHDLGPEFVAQPPPKQPDAPNVSFRFSGDDLNPLNPSFDIVAAVLAMGGYQIPQEAIDAAKMKAAMMMATGGVPNIPGADQSQPAAPQLEHGGPAEQAEPLSKNQLGDGDYR